MQPAVHPTAIELVTVLRANSTFTNNEPSADFARFLKRIEEADPAAFDEDDDNSNDSWGHYQFTTDSLTCTRVLDSWDSVGSPSDACQLIAAVLTTCHVARWLCRERGRKPSSFLSDSYLTEVSRLLWSCYQKAGGVSHALFISSYKAAFNNIYFSPFHQPKEILLSLR